MTVTVYFLIARKLAPLKCFFLCAQRDTEGPIYVTQVSRNKTKMDKDFASG